MTFLRNPFIFSGFEKIRQLIVLKPDRLLLLGSSPRKQIKKPPLCTVLPKNHTITQHGLNSSLWSSDRNRASWFDFLNASRTRREESIEKMMLAFSNN